jgi:predicted SAM-dependent methyltransferase
MKVKELLRPLLSITGQTSFQKVERVRRKLASYYLKGKGIEIGELHRPIILNGSNQKTKILYLDRFDSETLRDAYPELKELNLVNVDIVDNGETLQEIKDSSLDFIIANHFIEHCENPIGTIRNHVRKLRENGILFYAIPNKAKTFDKNRPTTSFEHLVKDDQLGPEISRLSHYQEWVEKVLRVPSKEIQETIEKNISLNYSIHFHVWDEKALIEFAKKIADLMQITLLEFSRVRGEIILIFIKHKVN